MSSLNSHQMQRGNTAAVLHLIYENRGIFRQEIAARTGLTPATVTNITAALLRDGRILEIESEACLGPGRKPIALAVNPDYRCLVGLEISADTVICVIADFSGTMIAHARCGSSPDATPRDVVQAAWTLTQTLLKNNGIAADKVLGVGMTSSGPYDYETGTVYDPPNFRGEAWKCAPLKRLFEEISGLAVLFEKDSVGCALSEPHISGTLFAVMINMIGIGGGLTFNGAVHHGRSNAAAEIGHVIVVPDGPRCGCGDRGCLEAVASGSGLAGEWSRLNGMTRTVDDLIAAFRAGDAAAASVVHTGASRIGTAISSVIKIISPDRILIGGRLITQFPEFYGLIQSAALSRRYIQLANTSEIMPFSHGDLQAAVGAVHLVLHRYYESLTA